MQAPTEIPPGEEETLYFQPTKNRATNYNQHTRCPRGWTTLGHHLMVPSVMTWLCLRNTVIKQQPVYCLPGNVTQAGSHLRVRAVIYPSHPEQPRHNQASLPLPPLHIPAPEVWRENGRNGFCKNYSFIPNCCQPTGFSHIVTFSLSANRMSVCQN